MRRLIPLLLLAACAKEPKPDNRAATIAKSHVQGATCKSTWSGDIEIAVCSIPDPTGGQFVAVYSDKHPFQAFRFKKVGDDKPTPPPPPTPPPAEAPPK